MSWLERSRSMPLSCWPSSSCQASPASQASSGFSPPPSIARTAVNASASLLLFRPFAIRCLGATISYAFASPTYSGYIAITFRRLRLKLPGQTPAFSDTIHQTPSASRSPCIEIRNDRGDRTCLSSHGRYCLSNSSGAEVQVRLDRLRRRLRCRKRMHHAHQFVACPNAPRCNRRWLPAWKYDTITCDGYSGEDKAPVDLRHRQQLLIADRQQHVRRQPIGPQRVRLPFLMHRQALRKPARHAVVRRRQDKTWLISCHSVAAPVEVARLATGWRVHRDSPRQTSHPAPPAPACPSCAPQSPRGSGYTSTCTGPGSVTPYFFVVGRQIDFVQLLCQSKAAAAPPPSCPA